MGSSSRVITSYSDLGHASYLAEVARGRVSGSMPFGSYGKHVAVGAETNQVIWPDAVFTLPSASGVQMTIVSTSLNDASAGTHGRKIEIHYLDANLIPREEIVTLDGTTNVLTVATDIRFINEMHLTEIGANSFTDGTITAKNAAVIYAQMDTNSTKSMSSVRMVPAGKKCFIAGTAAGASSGTSSADVVVEIIASEIDQNQYVDPLIFFPYGGVGLQDASESFLFPVPMAFSAGTVIGLMHTTDKAATITGSWFGWLEDV